MFDDELLAKEAKEALRDLIPEIKGLVLNTNIRAEDRLHAAQILISIAHLEHHE